MLAELATGEATPDLIGFDHYLTSERFLDHRVEPLSRGSSPARTDSNTYVDVEAVRVAKLAKQLGPRPRLRETWDRYNIPIVITEVHHGCTRDEQVRWLARGLDGSRSRRAREGVDLRAVTLWALFGLVDWRSLLTRREGLYDVGVLRHPLGRSAPDPDREGGIGKLGRGETIRSSRARPAGLVAAAGPHPCAAALRHAATAARREPPADPDHRRDRHARQGLRPHLRASRPCARPDRPAPTLDITDDKSIAAAIERHQAVGGHQYRWVRRVPGEAEERSTTNASAINATGPELLARACKAAGLPLVTFSSDLVFDGKLGRAYVEPDEPAPACAYGQSKAEAESAIAGDRQRRA